MRLIGEFKSEQEAFSFQAFLKAQKIPSVYELTQEAAYRLWVIEEEDFDKAYAFYQDWLKNPHDPRFEVKEPPSEWKVRSNSSPSPRKAWTLNHLIIFICTLLFIINGFQNQNALAQSGIIAVEYEVTPLEKEMLFDYPQFFVNIENFFKAYPARTPEELKELSPEGQACFEKIKNAPTWKGIADLMVSGKWNTYHQIPAGTLFGKIRQGELWRLYTPVLLHGGILHLLFNMAWVWMLGKSIEQRLGALRYLLLSVIIAIVSNIAQYLMSGPEFLGYSGIVVGMVGFIWMRQKIAPWEGYPLDPTVVRFIAIYVLGLLVLGIVSMTLDFFHVTEMYANIANTAHIVGGLTGIACARIPLFNRIAR